MIFYDYEVFIKDWLVVTKNTDTQEEKIIINNVDELRQFHKEHENDVWVGYNNNHYDQYVHKAILIGDDPYKISKYIVEEHQPGWKYSNLFRQIKMINYDVMVRGDGGLKSLEGFMGSNIKESDVDFTIQRKLTDEEIQETIKYCRHDVEETMQVFIQRLNDFKAQLQLCKLPTGTMDMKYLPRSKAQMAAIILETTKKSYDDEFNIDFPSTLQVNKYRDVIDWYKDEENRDYSKSLTKQIQGMETLFAWGGVHGAIPQYFGVGEYFNMDVTSLYPSLMIRYDLLSRSISDPKKFKEIYDTRVKYKHEGNPLQAPLKIVINSTYGAMKDKNNRLYDPRQANRVCIYGQTLLLDLMEKLEPYVQLIQCNTDGILVKLRKSDDFDLVDDICYEWEKRTGLSLEFTEWEKVFQKDVNNYVLVSPDGKVKTKGAYVKSLNKLDYNLPILNTALKEFFVNGTPVEETINNCNDLYEFQLIAKLSYKYSHFLHGGKQIPERCVRVFASKSELDGDLIKVHSETNRPAKFPNSPEHCFIENDNVLDVKVPQKLDRDWYIDLAKKRLEQFGVNI